MFFHPDKKKTDNRVFLRKEEYFPLKMVKKIKMTTKDQLMRCFRCKSIDKLNHYRTCFLRLDVRTSKCFLIHFFFFCFKLCGFNVFSMNNLSRFLLIFLLKFIKINSFHAVWQCDVKILVPSRLWGDFSLSKIFSF